jgi:hypothetical protein
MCLTIKLQHYGAIQWRVHEVQKSLFVHKQRYLWDLSYTLDGQHALQSLLSHLASDGVLVSTE